MNQYHHRIDNLENLLFRACRKMIDMKKDLEACEEELSGEGYNDPDLNNLLCNILEEIKL